MVNTALKSVPQLQSLKGRRKRCKSSGAMVFSSSCTEHHVVNHRCVHIKCETRETGAKPGTAAPSAAGALGSHPTATSCQRGEGKSDPLGDRGDGGYLPDLLPVQSSDMKRLSKQRDVLCRKKGKPDAREEGRILQKTGIHTAQTGKPKTPRDAPQRLYLFIDTDNPVKALFEI